VLIMDKAKIPPPPPPPPPAPKAETAEERMAREAKQDAANQKGYDAATKPDRLKKVLPFKAGGVVGSASKRADGCAQRGKTRGKVI
jgi:hypothetical protein